jgi:hypothetical protein
MRQPNPDDPTTYPQYDAQVHDLPLSARCSVGDAIDSPYVGSATITDVYPDAFYGAPPVVAGDPAPGRWDGLAYEAIDSSGTRHVLDRSRLGRVTSAVTAVAREPVTSPSLPSVEDRCEGSCSSDISFKAASQAEDVSPVTSPHDGGQEAERIFLDAFRCADCSRVHPFLPCAPITPAQHVAALSMPFDPSAVSRSRCTFKGTNRPCDPTHPAKCSRASTHSLPAQGPIAPVPGMPMALLKVYAGCPAYFDDARDLYVRRVDAGDSDALAMNYALHSAMVPANYAPETWPDVSRGDRMVVRWLARNVAVI